MATPGVTAALESCSDAVNSDSEGSISSRRVRAARQLAARQGTEAKLAAAYSQIAQLEGRIVGLIAIVNEMASSDCSQSTAEPVSQSVSSILHSQVSSTMMSNDCQPLLFDLYEQTENIGVDVQTDLSFPEHFWPCQVAFIASDSIVMSLCQVACDQLSAHMSLRSHVSALLGGIGPATTPCLHIGSSCVNATCNPEEFDYYESRGAILAATTSLCASLTTSLAFLDSVDREACVPGPLCSAPGPWPIFFD